MALTQLEMFRATLEHREHEGVLYYASFTPDLEGRVREAQGLGPEDSLQEHFGMYVPKMVSLRPPPDRVKPDFAGYYRDVEIGDDAYIDAFGVLHERGSFYHFTHKVSPLRNASRFEAIETFPYPCLDDYTDDHMAGEVEAAHRAGRVACCPIGHMYEVSWQVRGYEAFLVDMVQRPEWCEYILDRFTERNIRIAQAGARAGADYIRCGDDVANQNALMFAPDQWRRFMKARWAKVYEAARRIKPDIGIWYHSDGNIEAIIPELLEIGVTILNPVQPECMDPVDLKARFGDRIVIDGAIGTQTTMPFGSPEEVRRVVLKRVEELAGDGAYIASPTHILEPEVSLANLAAFVETARGVDGGSIGNG
ncbi:MAG: uroporphyrinogen decarboxylase family protein [Candidatus Latescibacteria bacterium]|jgi:uroporphyrinogen decarboxylase|nr:uroporphyrinogen decarboxylase family protein [Candidatus Latescibacterota bacterium]